MDGAGSLTKLIITSRRINRLLGGSDEMLCSRAHQNDWWAFVFVLDGVFVVVKRRRHRHCEEVYRWERRYGHELPTPKINWKKVLRGGLLPSWGRVFYSYQQRHTKEQNHDTDHNHPQRP